jgi:hypothetical protein
VPTDCTSEMNNCSLSFEAVAEPQGYPLKKTGLNTILLLERFNLIKRYELDSVALTLFRVQLQPTDINREVVLTFDSVDAANV